MEKTLIQELNKRAESCRRVGLEFHDDADKEFLAGKIVGEQANRRLAREFEGRACTYKHCIELIKEYIGISE